jgi:hypothetical protein
MSVDNKRALARTVLYGSISSVLYALLYIFEQDILGLSRQGGWNFIVPMVIAFAFSLVHGNFTGQFWELFGIKAKTTKK